MNNLALSIVNSSGVQSIHTDAQARQVLMDIKTSLKNNDAVIPINADFYFTKGTPGNTSGYILRDQELENEVMRWINTRTSFDTLIKRYQQYDKKLTALEWPSHYATRFINVNGSASKSENIFMFFPEVLGLHTGQLDDYFGFEFVDVWTSVFDEIVFPCMRRIFDDASQLKLFSTLRPSLEKTIYLASVFHEIGHRCGYWKVSPTKDSRIHINQFHTDVLGELATDTLLVNFLKEFPEVQYFIFLQRLFWFGRFGFKANPMSGKLNEDNDTWVGSYLWNKYLDRGVLKQNSDHRWSIDFDQLNTVFSEVLIDIDVLGEHISHDATTQDEIIYQWMRSQVKSVNDRFVYPPEMQSVFIRCVDIAEKPLLKY